MSPQLEEEILHLFREPAIGSGYANLYGEENMIRLVEKYRSLDEADRHHMGTMIADFSLSGDLGTSLVSVAVLHALGRHEQVEAAYRQAQTRDDAQSVIHHFEIGKSLADHFISGNA